MKCEDIQEILSCFVDGELNENIDYAFSHVFSCLDCQEFLKVTLKFKVDASKDKIEFPEVEEFEVKGKGNLIRRFVRSLKVEIPIPTGLLSAVVVMLFLLSFLLAVFVYDKAMMVEQGKFQVPVHKEKTRIVVVYGIPQVIVYPDMKIKEK
ncbi:hypothetical protein JGI3_01186 [Candidatus Kryptobacter tengchongensis]|uniref:Zinc-finger n=2 Tax=Kryptobacter tengchongensis TaxID=1643429 RepID=A0A916LKW5_KRYT1|nr:hypothetical protein JGI20_00060 [Candidatus Kryptobacter tengchongensis]CUT05007.1 hypothetical protein JGI25_01514 [Candidatus Kryptobacter tengchongensis]CUU05738.1 hypothetical protein JGI3_01186 [Candidatus Kryptobacter tengchongensis]